MGRAILTVVFILIAWVPLAQASLGSPTNDAPAAITKRAAGDKFAACGSRGGPGYRKTNGKCASWRR